MNLPIRGQRGNVLILVGAITLGLILAVILFALDYNQILGSGHQQLSAVESAGLAAAQDLSRIVIKDPNYGYIALADYPPVGKATLAADNIPCPVTGINTILGTARLDTLIAQQSGNADLKALAARDATNAKKAAANLVAALKQAIQPGNGGTGSGNIVAVSNGNAPAGPYTDMDGNYISPYDDAKNIYKSNLVTMSNGGTPVLERFGLSLGFVNNGSTTRTPIPNPADNNAQSNQVNGNYKAFVNIPTDDGTAWYFAGVSAQPALVDARNFQTSESDSNQVASAVLVQGDHTFIRRDTQSSVVHSVACAEPSAGPDTPPGGVLSVMFPDGLVPGINSTYDLFNNSDMQSNGGFVTQANGGDWPFTPGSSIIPGQITTSGGSTGTPTVEQMWAHAFFSWVRSAHTKPKVDQTVALIKQQGSFIFSMLPDGSPAPSFDICQRAYAQAPPANAAVQTALQSGTNASARQASLLQPGNANAVTAYCNMADYTPVITQLGSNSWQVGMSSNGTVTSADGSTTLSNATISNFWGQVNDTNTAALGAMGMGQSVITLAQSGLGTYISGQSPASPADLALQTACTKLVSDLNSLVTAIQSDTGPVPGGKVSPILVDETAINTALAAASATAQGYAKQIMYGVNAVANGAISGYETYMMIQHQNWLTSQGISQSGSNFTVANATFTEHPTPPVNSTAISSNSATSGNPSNLSWTAAPDVPGGPISGFYCYDLPAGIQNDTDGAPPNQQQVNIPWKFYFYQYDANGNVVRTHQEDTPFYDMPISDRQNMSISYKAVTTNGTVPVVWTAVSRVQSANLGQGRHLGQTWPGDPVNWCDMPYFLSGSAPVQQMGEGSNALGISVVNSGALNPSYSSLPQQSGKNVCWWDALTRLFAPPAYACGGGHGGCGHGHGHGHGHGGGSALHGSGNAQPGAIPMPTSSFQVAASGTLLTPQPRPNYYCGGLAADFQLCAPLAIPNASNTKQNNLSITAGSGPATYTDASGTAYGIPSTTNMAVQQGGANAEGLDGQPGSGNSQQPLPQPDDTVL